MLSLIELIRSEQKVSLKRSYDSVNDISLICTFLNRCKQGAKKVQKGANTKKPRYYLYYLLFIYIYITINKNKFAHLHLFQEKNVKYFFKKNNGGLVKKGANRQSIQ